MAKLRNNDKFERTLTLLLSFRQPDVVAFMSLRGFGAADRQEGFELLDKAAGRDLAMDDIVRAVPQAEISPWTTSSAPLPDPTSA